MEQDDIYLIDMWRVLLRQWRWFVAVLIVVLALTFAYTRVARDQWEATAWIQIGQIAPAPAGQDPKVESLLRVIERLETVAFQDEVVRSIGLTVESREASLYRKSMKLDPEPYANLIKMRVRAYSPRQAADLVTATVTRLEAIHRQIGEVPLRLANQRLDEIEADLRTAQADRDRLSRDAGTGTGLASVLLASKNEDIRALQQARSELVARLVPNYTFETSMPWPIYVPERKAFPNPVLIWGIGLLTGLFLGGLAAVGRDAMRRTRR
ncbi:subunit length determinant protein [Luteibacter rhizovicinus]|uniref:Subunit length determinant protein n=1 Tax=Luteibacter rhizovicinus TaxID=242606 RepID=A0A4R3YZ26_9GAMM|nr:Wzz/FepE/Etk N-terminal domain-containing protein [Luteibacter rhizovicinus]TCV97812.1 subunit length determinant protein [Luteibacter rhizovicinus]